MVWKGFKKAWNVIKDWFKHPLKFMLQSAIIFGAVMLIIYGGWKIWVGFVIGLAIAALLAIKENHAYSMFIQFFQEKEVIQDEKEIRNDATEGN